MTKGFSRMVIGRSRRSVSSRHGSHGPRCHLVRTAHGNIEKRTIRDLGVPDIAVPVFFSSYATDRQPLVERAPSTLQAE